MRRSTTVLVRGVVRGIGWVLLAIVGGLAAWAAGWVPPELAAMLGSRVQEGQSVDIGAPEHRPARAATSRRGTPRTTRADARRPNKRGTRTSS